MIFTFWRIVIEIKRRINPQTKVLYLSDTFLVVHKDFDLVINDDDPSRDSLYSRLSIEYPNLRNFDCTHGFYVLHRLDYSTSGVLIIPLTKNTASDSSKTFQSPKRLVEKYYIALLRGIVSEPYLNIKLPIGNDSGWPQKMKSSRDKNCIKPRASETSIIVLSYGYTTFDGYPCTKVIIKLHTGRRHQIRVHCSALGHSIVGDYTYSNKKDLLPNRMFLHSYRIIAPFKDELIDVDAGDPFGNTCFIPLIQTDQLKSYRSLFENKNLPWMIVSK